MAATGDLGTAGGGMTCTHKVLFWHCSICRYIDTYVRAHKSGIIVSSELHSSDRIGRQGKKDQRPSSNSGPTLYRGVSAT